MNQLIEQLADDFIQLIRFSDHFVASGKDLGAVHGKTPEEALEGLLTLRNSRRVQTEPPLPASQVPSPFDS